MKKHYATHVEDTDKLISVAGPILEYETWYEQYKKLMEEQAQRKYGLYTPTSEGGDDFDPSSFDQAWTVAGKTNEDSDRATIANIAGNNNNNLTLTNFGFVEGSGYNQEGEYAGYLITDGVDDKVVSSNFVMDKEFTIVGEWKLVSDKMESAGIVKPSSLFVFNKDSSNKYLVIGNNGNHFTKIALKNLAIYNHILSKDDCIKAYDYLQTLKAK
jgi:hypothetical protein